MNKNRFQILRLVPLGIVLIAFLTAAGLSSLKKAPAEKERQDSTPLVRTSTVATCDQGFFVEVDGEVTPYRQITLSAQVAGRDQNKIYVGPSGVFCRRRRTVVGNRST